MGLKMKRKRKVKKIKIRKIKDQTYLSLKEILDGKVI